MKPWIAILLLTCWLASSVAGGDAAVGVEVQTSQAPTAPNGQRRSQRTNQHQHQRGSSNKARQGRRVIKATCPTNCPTALQAAQFLTGENPALAISSASLTTCTLQETLPVNTAIVTDWSGTAFANTFSNAGALVLSTGDALAVCSETDVNVESSKVLLLPGDPDLQTLTSLDLADADVLQFDVTPTQSGSLKLQYVWGSEEYPDYVNEYNDLFAVFIDGENVAIVPGTTDTPISVNTVNKDFNSQLFVSNTELQTPNSTVIDGYTTLLTTKPFSVTAGQPVTVKIAIADSSEPASEGIDYEVDSWVLLKGGSLQFLCDPSKPCCQPDGNFKPEGTTCRAATKSCDVSETCTGTSAECPEDIKAADGTTCTRMIKMPHGKKHYSGYAEAEIEDVAVHTAFTTASTDGSEYGGETSSYYPGGGDKNMEWAKSCEGMCKHGSCVVDKEALHKCLA